MKGRASLLLITGTNDHTVPIEVVKLEKKKYHGPAVVELNVFEGRTHGMVKQQGWEEVADFAIKMSEFSKRSIFPLSKYEHGMPQRVVSRRRDIYRISQISSPLYFLSLSITY